MTRFEAACKSVDAMLAMAECIADDRACPEMPECTAKMDAVTSIYDMPDLPCEACLRAWLLQEVPDEQA